MRCWRPGARNAAPAFPDQDPGTEGVQDDQADRSVAENTPAGQPVGAPAAATDEDAADVLTYTLAGDDAGFFSIDVATGQLRTKEKLDFEATGDDNYRQRLRGHRPRLRTPLARPRPGDDTNSVAIMVTITVTDVDEAPSVATGATTISHAENVTVLDVDLSNQECGCSRIHGD